MTDRPIVHVVDDDEAMRLALEGLFDSAGLKTHLYEKAKDFLEAELPDTPSCIVLDVRLPDANGLEFQAQLTELGVHLPVVMMTGHGDIPMSVRAMKRGAVDFLTKPFRHEDMLNAVTAAIDRDRKRRSVEAELYKVEQQFRTLTVREKEVMRLVASGKMNKQVAGELGISEITVKIHRGSAMRKMHARTLADLIRMAELIQSKPA